MGSDMYRSRIDVQKQRWLKHKQESTATLEDALRSLEYAYEHYIYLDGQLTREEMGLIINKLKENKT